MGRKQGIKPPPPAGAASGAVHLPITADQLAGWATEAGLSIMCGDLEDMAERITHCLEWYPLWDLIKKRRSALAARRDWCNQVSKQAHDLLFALGFGPVGRTSPGFQDTLAVLNVGWDQKDSLQLHQLDRQARLAVPDRWHELLQEGQQPTGQDVFGLVGHKRLAASLRLLETLAARAAEYHGKNKQPGGKGRGSARLRLFTDLSRLYREMFGKLPTITRHRRKDDPDSYRSGGPSWRFFRLLLDHVRKAAEEGLALLPAGDSAGNIGELRAQWLKLSEAASTASGIAGEGDPLAHLIWDSVRAVRAADKRKAPRAEAQKSSE